MFKSLKINIALFTCLAFVLRLAIININFISDLSLAQNLSSKHCVTYNKHQTEVEAPSSAKKYTLVEVFEEDSDNEEDDETKTNTPVLLFIVHSCLQHLNFSSGSNTSFDRIKCELFSKLYLSISVLRI